jgi:hypothetical protein
VLKQSGDLLNWRPKSRRSQTPIAELGQSRAACGACRASAFMLLLMAHTNCGLNFWLPDAFFSPVQKRAVATATDRPESSDGVES